MCRSHQNLTNAGGDEDDFCAIFRLSRREFLTRTLALGAVAAPTSSGALCRVLRGNSKQGSIESKISHFCLQLCRRLQSKLTANSIALSFRVGFGRQIAFGGSEPGRVCTTRFWNTRVHPIPPSLFTCNFVWGAQPRAQPPKNAFLRPPETRTTVTDCPPTLQAGPRYPRGRACPVGWPSAAPIP